MKGANNSGKHSKIDIEINDIIAHFQDILYIKQKNMFF